MASLSLSRPSPEQRRPVEVDAAHEDQLVAWLSKRMGAPMKPPHLQAVGYALEGGRLLPGGQGPVAQFMYHRIDATGPGSRLTLYVSNEVGDLGAAAGGAAGKDRGAGTAFRFAREGSINVFYWVEGRFGYAISADAGRATLPASRKRSTGSSGPRRGDALGGSGALGNHQAQ